MARIIDDHLGERLAIRGSRFGLVVDRTKGQLRLSRYSMTGRPREQIIALERLEKVVIEIDEVPGINRRAVGQILSSAMAAARGESVLADPESLAASMPKALYLRVVGRDERGTVEPFEAKFAVDGIDDLASAVELALKLAASADLTFGAVGSIPGAGIEIQLGRESECGSPPLAVPATEDEVREFATDAVAKAVMPVFDPSAFESSHRVEQWAPGQRVVFRRPLNRAAPIIAPFSLLLLAGPALLLVTRLYGLSLPGIVLGVTMVFGLLLGAVALLLLRFMLPRTVEVDWPTQTVTVATWFRTTRVPFADIERLELRAKRHVSSGGESSSTVSFFCELLLVRRGTSEEASETLDLFETTSYERLEKPLRASRPLLADLARAMGLEGRFVDYDFRTAKPSRI